MSWSETDYRQTMEVWKQLVDVRFRLLALVPTLTAIGVGMLSGNLGTLRVSLVAALGLVAVFAIRLYDLRNSELHDFVVHRLKMIERSESAGLKRSARVLTDGPGERWPDVVATDKLSGGAFSERPPAQNSLLGFRVKHDPALSLVYTASLGAWTTLLAHFALKRLTDLEGNGLLVSVAVITIALVLAVEVGVAMHGAQDRYLKHVLTSGELTDPWEAWTEEKSFFTKRTADKVRAAETKYDERYGKGRLEQQRLKEPDQETGADPR